MGRPPTRRFRLAVSVDASDAFAAMVRDRITGQAAGLWPRRPPAADRFPDVVLDRLRAEYSIPRLIDDVLDPMALLEQELLHAKESIVAEQRMSFSERKTSNVQIKRIAAAPIGSRLGFRLTGRTLELLTGAALFDPKFGSSNITRVDDVRDFLSERVVVNTRLRAWAQKIIAFGGTNDRSHKAYGGGYIEAELVFVSVLLHYYERVLGRRVKRWASYCNEQSSAECTRFIRDCLALVGVRARTAPPSRKIRLPAPDLPPRTPRALTLADAHQRILRVLREHDEAERAGLPRNYLSRQLNKSSKPRD